MITLKPFASNNQLLSNDFYFGEFDAAIGLPPKYAHGPYWLGYLNYTLKTGKPPF